MTEKTAAPASDSTAIRSARRVRRTKRRKRRASRTWAQARISFPTTVRGRRRRRRGISIGSRLPAAGRGQALAPEQLEVGVDHETDELLEARGRLPAEVDLGLRRVADELIDLGGAHEGRVEQHVARPAGETVMVEGDLAALARRGRPAARD